MRDTLRTLTWWPMRIGWVCAALAVLSGLIDQSILPPQPPYQTLLNNHITTGLGLLVTYGAILYQQWLFQQRNRDANKDILDNSSQRLLLTVLLLLGGILVLTSGWLGGQLVYEWGIGVNRE
ncbi:MAG: DUF2231 domain-containing protein, partial [Chloroflexota bacterium]